MRRLVEYIAKSLVDEPEAVQVREVRNDRNVLALELNVAPDDFGKVIGRQGRVAKAMRTLLRAGGTRRSPYVTGNSLREGFLGARPLKGEWDTPRLTFTLLE